MNRLEQGVVGRTTVLDTPVSEDLAKLREDLGVDAFLPTRTGDRGRFGKKGREAGLTGVVGTTFGREPVDTDDQGRLIFDVTS